MFGLFKKKKNLIKIKSNTKILYRKNYKEVLINCELTYPSKNKYGIVVYVSELLEWIDSKELISNKDFLEMKQEIYHYFRREGYSISIN